MEENQGRKVAAQQQHLAHLREESAGLRRMLDELRARARAEESTTPPPRKSTAS